MFNTAKRFFAFFVLAALAATVPVSANPLKRDSITSTKVYNIEFQGSKHIPIAARMLTIGTSHSYVLKLKQGETAFFTLRSDKATSLKVTSPSGRITQQGNEKGHQGVLSGAGEFTIEVSSAEISAYTLSVTAN